MKLTIVIETGNDAMQTGEEVHAALVETSRRNFRNNGKEIASRDEGKIMDENGNKVGTWTLEGEPDEEEDEDN